MTPFFPREIFIKLMRTATKFVEFSFNKVIYQQMNGSTMGYPLGPAMANIFVGYYESLLFGRAKKPPMYCIIAARTILLLSLITKMIAIVVLVLKGIQSRSDTNDL